MAANGDAPRSESPSGSPRTASTSLQAAATMNAGLQHEPRRRKALLINILWIPINYQTGLSSSSSNQNRSSPQTGRRRSTVLMNLQLNDPSVPAPGEMVQEQSSQQRSSPQLGSVSPFADPHHHRAPSLGELHQELEAEQEAHVVCSNMNTILPFND
jgi:hypothetical protein